MQPERCILFHACECALADSLAGILISSTPVAVDNATADIAIFLMIGALRQAHKPLSGIREGRWRGDFTLGHDPNAKILGILGMGGIGKARHSDPVQ